MQLPSIYLKGYRLINYRTIGISDYKILREALADPAFAGRPSLNVFQDRSKDVIARGDLIIKSFQVFARGRFPVSIFLFCI